MLLLMGLNSKYGKYEGIFDKLRRHRITVAQMQMMCLLGEQGAKWTSMQDLLKHYKSKQRVGQSSVSRMLSNLSPKNRYGRDGHDYIEIQKEGEDERFIMIRLNKRGFQFLDRTLNI